MASHSAFSHLVPSKGLGANNRKFKPFQLQISHISNTARASYNTFVSEVFFFPLFIYKHYASYNTFVSEVFFFPLFIYKHYASYNTFVSEVFFFPLFIYKHYASYNTLVSEAARLLIPTANFEASKLEVVFVEKGLKSYSAIIPRTYILSHCDFTANLTLTISNVINLEQLKGWYNNDDVVAEWKKVKETMFLNVHCFVSGPNLLLDLAAEFRYHIFSKELPLVLKAVLHGDSDLFSEHPELMDALVCVYFHSSLPKYNQIECWGPLKDAAEGKPEDQVQGLLIADKESSSSPAKWGRRPKSIFQALFTFLL